MIIIKLQGGLGNQLFQYAFGRYLSVQNNCSLILDTTFFEDQDLRKYDLYHFNIPGKIATAKELSFLTQKKKNKLNRLFSLWWKPRINIVHEKNLLFDPAYLKTGKNSYLNGYWQSELYFNAVSSLIKVELTVKTPPSVKNQKLLLQFQKGCAISLHIRRGDFVNDDNINQIHGTCNIDYYQNAVSLMAGKTTNPVFYIFSDDIKWAEENLKIDHPIHFVTHNDEQNSFEDLRLMSHCEHHIIANSSFSWWGAWLNQNTDKIVIAPKKWFNNPEMNQQAKSIIPAAWITI